MTQHSEEHVYEGEPDFDQAQAGVEGSQDDGVVEDEDE